jgi:hypothetical protein
MLRGSDVVEVIGNNLMTVWTRVSYKTFKIGVEGTVVARLLMNRNVDFKELVKELRTIFGLGKDLTFMNIERKEYDGNEKVYQNRKKLWLERSKYGKDPRASKLKDFKIKIEVNGVENIFDAKYVLFGIENQLRNLFQY